MEFTQQSVAECSALLDKLEAAQNELVDTLRSNGSALAPEVRQKLVDGVEALSPQLETTKELLEKLRQRLEEG